MIKIIMLWIKRIVIGAVMLLSVWVLFNLQISGYLLSQLTGQMGILWNAEPIEKILEKTDQDSDTYLKLQLISNIVTYAQDSIGLNTGKAYSKFYDQKGKPVLWVVSATPEFDVTSYQWKYPILGKLTYKGFFNREKAESEAESLKTKGFDVSVREVNAWSSLGWYNDPVMSSMLNKSESELSELLFHELLHRTVYFNGNSTLSENLASFVGYHCTLKYLNDKYGENSESRNQYVSDIKNEEKMRDFMIGMCNKIQNLYTDTVFTNMVLDEKRKRKNAFNENFISELNILNSSMKSGKPIISRSYANSINNTFFSDYAVYHDYNDALDSILQTVFDGSIVKMIEQVEKGNYKLEKLGGA